jgi:transposase-like protein
VPAIWVAGHLDVKRASSRRTRNHRFYETIRLWCQKFGSDYARKLKRRQGRLRDTWHLDEVVIPINGQQQYLWRAVDLGGQIVAER